MSAISNILKISIDYFSTERAKVHLEEYFEQSRAISEDRHLSLLCIQCFEVSIA